MNGKKVKYKNYKLARLLVAGVIFVSLVSSCQQKKATVLGHEELAPISIEALRKRDFTTSLKFEKELVSGEGFNAELLSFYSDSLRIYALLSKPKTEKPEGGYPLIIFGHGFHPEPKKYGISKASGKSWRPGDYYRGVPESYARRGFVVLTPDYRGHNVSDGFEFTQMGFLAHNFYTIDLLHLVAALPSLENVNLDRVYYMGHSMGGDVGLRLLLTTNKISAASLWSPVAASTWQQVLYYGKYEEEGEVINTEKIDEYMATLQDNLNGLSYEYSVEQGDPINFIRELNVPVIIHHATGDQSVPYMWSESLVARLFAHKKRFEFYTYQSGNHLLIDENRMLAFDRDISFFNKYGNLN
ncbi:alpha/beta fold hydrolase [Reichenbachiella sp.]|uniref:alpha/beta hydrolase family protein n=1 Tax=Reichenbachiella sp. TaxID=2184521 RepID=UPI0032994DC9